MCSTFDPGIVAFGLAHEQSSGFAIQRIGGIRVPEELWQENLKDVDHVEHGRPGLVDDVEADRSGPREASVRGPLRFG